MRKVIILSLALVLCISVTMPVLATGEHSIVVTVNGNPIPWVDVWPFVDGNWRVMVPLRAVADAMDLNVDWNQNDKEAVFSSGNRTIYFRIGQQNARTSTGTPVIMDTAPVIVNNRTYAPIRYLAEFFGYQVNWNPETHTVSIVTTSAGTGEEITQEERFTRIAKNYCAAEYGITSWDGLNIKPVEYEGNECHILTYLPGYSGLRLFIDFIFDAGGNSSTAVADFWGKKTVFLIDLYDTAEEMMPLEELHRDEIEQISSWYNETEDNSFNFVGEFYGDAASGYWLNGNLVKAEVYTVTDVIQSVSGYTGTFYYHDGVPYCARIVGYGNLRDLNLFLYFWDGVIIRWIQGNGKIHFGNNSEYARYYFEAVEAYGNVQEAHNANSQIPLYTNGTVSVEWIELSESSVTLTHRESSIATKRIDVTVHPQNPTDQEITWTTDDENIAKVYTYLTGDGLPDYYMIQTGGGTGRTTVTAYCGGKSASCEVIVVPA